MLKNKLIRKPLAKQTPQPLVRKKLPKPPPIEDDEESTEVEESEIEGEEEVEETPPPVRKKVVSRPVEVEDEEGEEEGEGEEEVEEQPRRGAKTLPKKGKSAIASAFDSVPMSNSAEDVPAGKYECIIREAVIQPMDDRGQSIRFAYEICSPDFADKNRLVQWFKVIDADGHAVDWMVQMLKTALVRLLQEPIDGSQLEETLQEITDVNPGCILKVSYARGNDGNIYPRYAIQGPSDSDVVEAYKDNVAY